MKRSIVLGLAALVLCAQTPAATAPTAAGSVRHLVYRFGYNTKVAKEGTGTGTTTVTIAPAADGGLTITATDSWWNTANPRAANTCEVYRGGKVNCGQRPYAISPIQLTLFPLLAKGYFEGNAPNGASWQRAYTIYAAVLPGGSGMAGTPNTWGANYTFHSQGPIGNNPTILILGQGTLKQQGGHYWSATSKQRIAYDPAAHLPVAVSDVRTHFPQRSVYNNDLIELKLLSSS